ncbi:spatacsin [Hyperolius riggenbachi]|uniref:spatacsin n=1 Tax=Hyperolius riggenbachi TaxID=752182 RepID=UPI0035A28069
MELSVLLDPGITLQDWTKQPVRVSFLRHKNLNLCSLLPEGVLQVTVFQPGTPQGFHASPEGLFTQFLWEAGHGNDAVLGETAHLVALREDNEIRVYKVGVDDENEEAELTITCMCPEDMLRQLCAENHVCIPSLTSFRLLSLHDAHILLLVSNCFLVLLHYTGEQQKPRLVSCVCLELDPEAAERISGVCLRHEALFLLDSLGYIYVFDIVDGSPLAVVELPVRPDADVGETLNGIRVSPNLDLIVVTSVSSFLPLKLSEGFSEDVTLSLQTWRKERHFNSSILNMTEHSDEILGHGLEYGFRMDRTWDATLASLLKETNSCPAFPACPSAHSLMARNPCSDALLIWTVLGAGWIKIPTDNIKDPVGLSNLSLSSVSALFCLCSSEGCATLVHWMVEKQDFASRNLGNAVCVDTTDDEACLVITDRGLSLVLFSVSQNEFLTRLMIHGSASTADTLCHLNNWGRCSVPIHMLEAGLENRQLDTVDFFLKSKESILSPLTSEDGRLQSDHYQHNVEELVPALDLLFSYIHCTDQETQSKHFSEQLLQLTLHFLSDQVLTLCNLLAEPDPALDNCVEILSGYIIKLRPFMKRFYQQPFPVQAQPAESGHRAWENIPVEAIISDAILSNCIPDAQSFLRTKGYRSSLTWVKREGLKLAYRCLQERRVTEACQLLQNMGYSIWDELRRICFYTSDLAVRTLLVELLQQEGRFSEQDTGKIDIVCQVETLYRNGHIPAGHTISRASSKPIWKPCALSAEVQVLQDALNSAGDESDTLLLDWAQHWSSDTRESVLLPWKSSTDMAAVPPTILWRHLTLWNDWPSIVSWIESTGQNETIGDNQKSLWPLFSAEIIDDNTLCCSYTKQRILDKLSRMKIFVSSEWNAFETLVERLAVTHQLMLPAGSPLQHISTYYPEFHHRFVQLCIERDLQYLLYTYLDHHRLQPENCSALSDTSLHEAYPWFGFLVNIRQVSANTNDAIRMFHASLSNAHVRMPSYQPSVNSMLLDGHTLLALATNMYAPGGIDGVLEQHEEPSLCKWNMDPPLLKMALTPYPKLRAALFPQYPANSASPPDISLYHLLQSLPPFHPAHFFTWQHTNSLAAADSIMGLPHCSCPQLVSKLSAEEELDVFFYLRSGRPAVAFSNFLVHQLLKSKVPEQLIQRAVKDVYSLALSCFSVPSIIASCVSFLELLGVSSHKLRVDVFVANLILKHSTSQQEAEGHKSNMHELAQRLEKLVDNESEAAKDLLLSLEEVVAASLQEESSKPPCNGLWITLLQFCFLHHIPVSSAYLRNFAQKQDWLQLLVHANSQDQIFTVVEELNPVLGSHITLALQDKEPPACATQGVNVQTDSDTVHHVLLKCLSAAEPGQMLLKHCVTHRVPLFSVLATCVQDTDSISCLCAWIVTSVDAATYLEITQTLSPPADNKWNLEDLTQIWNLLLARSDYRTLHKAFSIFLEECPLLLLFEAFDLCMEYKNYSDAKEKLQVFQEKMEKLQSLDDSIAAIPVVWLQSRTSHLLELLLLQSRTLYELQKVLQLLCDSTMLCCGVDLDKLKLLTEILEDQPFFISKDLLSNYSPAALQVECQRLLQVLLDGGHFSLAHQVAELAELSTDNLVIEEVLQDQRLLQEIGQWLCPQSRVQYWRKCHEIFNANHLSPLEASSFFHSQASSHVTSTEHLAEQVESLAEQELLLTLAGHWLSLGDGYPLQTLEELEQQIWKCRIEQEVLERSGGSRLHSDQSAFTLLAAEFTFSSLPALNTPLLLDVSTLPQLCGTIQGNKDQASTRILSFLIDRLLDESKVHEASRVCRYFQLSHRDLWLVLSCRAMASGEMSVQQLHPNIQDILTEGVEVKENLWNRRKRLQSSSSVESPSLQSPTNPVTTYLEILKDTCMHGKTYCKQLLCMFELSQELECSFLEVSSRDPSEVLRTVLSSHCYDLADRAQAVISSHGLPAETVAQIVAEESLKIWKTAEKEGGQSEIYNLSEKRANFLQLAKLCPDPTLVGLNLLEHLETVPLTNLHCIIEVLISAHDCFSLTCHLEGIGRVLQACRHFTEMHLAPKQEYSLMVRLLSGIGRYNDMVYVFDILHKNQHFEVLLRKQLDTKGGLQTALLEYIKRCHPGDSEKHNMTALCFSLHRDIGHNHEHAAKILLKLIQSQPWEYWLSELEELKSSIRRALVLLIDAAESYSKDSCVRQSLRCARLSRLLTLQLHMLSSGHKTRLINLNRESLMEPVLTLPRFYQAAVVIEAYDVLPDWAEILYNRVVAGGDFQYLEDGKQRQLLNKGMFEQISNKCKLNPPGTTGLQNLKRVISYCEDINTRYKLAFEHKFYDITDVLMRDSQTRCCLTDMLS